MILQKKYIVAVVSFLLLHPVFSQKLSMQEALSIAEQNNRSLRAAAIDLRVAGQEVKVARSATLPNLSFNTDYRHYFNLSPFFGFDPNGNTSTDKIPYSRFGGDDQMTAFLSAAYPVFDATARPAIKQALLGVESSRQTQRQQRIDVRAEVKKTYLNILLLHERLKLQLESYARNLKALKDAKALFAQGRALRVDTLRAYTNYKNLEPEINNLRKLVRVQSTALANLIGIDSTSSIEVSDSLKGFSYGKEGIAEQSFFEEASNGRPDLQVLNLQRQISAQQIDLEKGNRLPVVNLIGQYGVVSQTNDFKFFDAYYPRYSFAGFQVNFPLFTGYRNQTRIRQAELRKERSDLVFRDARENLRTQVQQALARVDETLERIETGAQVVEAARASYQIVQYRYEKGLAPRLELTDTELALTSAQINYLQALYEHQIALIELDQVRGRD